MNNCMHKLFVMAVLAASVLVVPLARAQLQTGEGTMSSTNAEDFDDLVAQDVAKGYYTAEQGEQLKAQWDQSMQNLTESLQKAQTAVQRTDSLAQSGNQMTFNQVSSLANAQGQTTLGGTPEEVEEQAKAIYNAAHLQLEVGQAQIENVTPVLQSAINEISTVVNARNALIQSNPNVSPAVKHNSGREAAQVEDATKNAIQSGIGKFTEQMQQAQATLDNNKQQIINQIENTINTKSAAEGTDPTKWTKPTPPAKTTPPVTATKTPTTPETQAPTAGPVMPTTLVPSNNGSVTGTTTKTTTGTVPSNEGDPALSATRNSNNGKGTATNSNNGTSTSASSKTSAANNGTPSNANNNANSSTNAGVQISQHLTPPNVSKPPTPPAKPKLTQQDLNNALNKKENIPEMQVALPPPTNSPPNAPKDDKGITLLDKPPANPSGNAKAVVKGTPPSKTNSDVTVPVPLKNASDLPLPIDVHLEDPSQSQDPGGTPQGQTGQTQDQVGQSQGTLTPSSGDGTNGTGTNSAAAAAAAAANAAAAAAADAASSSTDAASSATSAAGASAGDAMSNAGTLNKTPNATIIPNSPNNPNAQSMTDPSFNAYRNNPNGAPPDATSQSGDVTTGTSNPNPGGFVPPNQQNNSQDSSSPTSAAADAAAAAAAAAVSDAAATGPTPAPATPQPSKNPTLDEIQAQIASQLKAGNLGGHLVEGDEGVEGTTDATAGVQMASLGNLDESVELGDTLTTATLASIYTGYTVTPGQNGSSVIVAGTTQVKTPSSLMTSPSMQVSTPGAMMTSPSMQVQFPSSAMTDPSMQVLFPDALLVIPSNQINFPSTLMNSLEMQVALCGR